MKLESFSAILSDCTSKYNKIKKEDYLPEGQFPIIDQGQKFVGGYTDDDGLITDIEKELIIFGDHTKILKFINFPIAIGADGVKVLHVNKEKADPRYIYYFLKSVKLTDAGYSRHFKFLKEINIPVPENINDQIKIARLLNHVETLIAQRKKSISLLDELLKSTFLEMFGDPSNNQKKFSMGTIRDVVSEVKYGTSKPAENNGFFPYLRMNNITVEGYMDFSNLKYINLEHNEIAKYVVKKGDIIFNRTNSKELVGKTGLFNQSSEMAIAGYLIRIRTNEKVNPWFIWGYLNSLHGKKTLFGMCKSIVGMANINAQELQEIKIVIPPIKIQNQFASIVEKVQVLKSNYEASLIELEKMYGVLSQKAFNGNLISNEEEIKKKSKKVIEDHPKELDMEKYLKEMEILKANKVKRDITYMSLAEYFEFPEELQMSHEKWMFNFLGEDEFYQFLLKDDFKDTSFTLGDLETKFHNFFYHVGDMDFDNEKWKEIIFKFLEADPPLIEQFFEEETATIKLKLTDEAYKA